MVDSTDPSTWVYDPRYDNAEKWNNAQDADLNPSNAGDLANAPHSPRVTSSRDAWMRSVHAPNATLIVHCQKLWVHDASEARRDDEGRMTVTCTCGLIVAIDFRDDAQNRKPFHFPKFFAGNHGMSIELQREFFEHPGHRDPFHKTVLGGFLVRLREPGLEQDVFLEHRCITCGWLPLGYELSGDWEDFEKYAHRFPIDMHNLRCPQPGTECWDGDMYLWGHGPASAARARKARREREEAERGSGGEETLDADDTQAE